jgi:hypothetical protein
MWPRTDLLRRMGVAGETSDPPLVQAEPGHAIRCHIPIGELAQMQGIQRDGGTETDTPR